MVREYNKNDIDVLIKLFDLHNELSPNEEVEKRKELEEGARVLVYEEDGEVKGMCSYGFWNNSELGICGEIIMSVENNLVLYKAANALWEAVQAPISEKGAAFLTANYNEKKRLWREFYDEKQFQQWFGIHGMIYRGGRFEETALTFKNYEEADFETYHTCLGQCFSPMRTANDIKPFDVFKGSSPERIEHLKKQALDAKDRTYLFYDGENFVGSTIIKHEEIDDVFVVPEFQGLGYGRKIMEATINMALERNFDRITLGAVAWNRTAINLYRSLGFEIYQSFEHRRLFLRSI